MLKRLSEYVKSEKGIKLIFVAGIALILLIFLSSLFGGSKSPDAANDERPTFAEDYEAQLERRLAAIIAEIDGTGEISVMITLEGGGEDVYSDNEKNVSQTLAPSVRGAVVVCSGCENVVIKQKVVEAVTKALGVSPTKICVTY